MLLARFDGTVFSCLGRECGPGSIKKHFEIKMTYIGF